MCRGRHFRKWFGGLLAGLGVETFGQLRIEDDERRLKEEQRYRLMVVVADVTRGELVRLPWDYGRYGLNPDEQLIVDAVAASTALPFLFEPVRLAYPRGESLLVDGGVLSNFPIDAFDRRDRRPPGWPTFGVKLIPPLPTANARLLSLHPRAGHPPGRAARRAAAHHPGRWTRPAYLRQPWVRARTVQVDTDAVNPFDFGIEEGKQRLLYSHGRSAAESFLETWDWQRYLREFRT